MTNWTENTGVVLVTGSRRGIGRETVRQLADRGYRVIASARRLADAQHVADEVGFSTVPFHLDVSDLDGYRMAF